ncbi:hypothetical protein [Streptomyces sp. SM12]|uniref:phage terminase small subunit n=1 Tax=Streptomyces sp. SM12 TaxID=1071602 RepID=UPI000CD5A169|nr:hypothetical protein [Streptomyces sp. SM12]
MAGNGPPPKPRGARARRNGDQVGQTVLRAEVVEPPALPARYRENDDVTEWWQTWLDSPQAEVFSRTDWRYLLDTLPLVAAYYDGELKWGSEIRLRVAQFGASPADRARLRMTFAAADEADARRSGPNPGAARERYGGMRLIAND